MIASKKARALIAVITVHVLIILLAKTGLNLSPDETATLLEVVTGSLALITSVYMHTQSKTDIATNGLTSGTVVAEIKKALLTEDIEKEQVEK